MTDPAISPDRHRRTQTAIADGGHYSGGYPFRTLPATTALLTATSRTHTDGRMAYGYPDVNPPMSTSARLGPTDLLGALIAGGITAAYLLPKAIEELTAVDTSPYSSGFQALWAIFDVVIVLAFFVGLTVMVMRRR